jgi:hypothetical protein
VKTESAVARLDQIASDLKHVKLTNPSEHKRLREVLRRALEED